MCATIQLCNKEASGLFDMGTVMRMSSRKPLPKKLFIREDYSIVLLNAPDDYESRLTPLPDGVSISDELENLHDLIQLFAANWEQLEKQLPLLIEHLKEDGWLWVSYPKGSSKVKTDITRDSIWEYAVGLGLKAAHQMSVDETWSAIRFRKQ